jgi:DNA modification methylase
MKPYFQRNGITLYHADCRDVLSLLPDRRLVVTDPPYNMGYHYDEYKDAMPMAEYWTWLLRVLSLPLVFIHYPEALFPVARHFQDPDKMVAWVYNAHTPRQWRGIGWFGIMPDMAQDGQDYKNPEDPRVAKRILRGERARLYDWWHMEQVKNVSSEKTDHPCQIPKALMTRILRVTPYDGPIVDPFAGSGTTLVAAYEMGRQAIGIEYSERYCEIIAERLSQGLLDLLPDDVMTPESQPRLL